MPTSFTSYTTWPLSFGPEMGLGLGCGTLVLIGTMAPCLGTPYFGPPLNPLSISKIELET